MLIEGISERAAADRFGINARTVSKMLKFPVPPGYVRMKPPFRPKLDAFIGIIDAILVTDKERPKKRRHTAKRICGRCAPLLDMEARRATSRIPMSSSLREPGFEHQPRR